MSDTRHELHLGYVLHSRPYRETSLLVEALTLEFGRITFVARGARSGKVKTSAILQPFCPLLLSWYGNSDLVTLTQVESSNPAYALSPRRIICALYLNELLVKLLHKWDPCLELFNNYQQALIDLAQIDIAEQAVLRRFEKQLLQSIGYGLQLTKDIETGLEVQADLYYNFEPNLGPSEVSAQHLQAIRGVSLLAFAADQYHQPEVLADLKLLMRRVFAYHLGNRAIVTRQLL